MKYYHNKYYLFLLATFFAFSLSTPASIIQNEVPRNLKRDKKISVSLNPGEIHTYELPLELNTRFHIIVTSNGIDVGLQLMSPSDELLNQVNSYSGFNETEEIMDVIEYSGSYKLKIQSQDNTAITGQYTIELVDVEKIVLNDNYKERILARNKFIQGEKFVEIEGGSEEKNNELFKLAIDEYDKSISLYKNIGDIKRVGEISIKVANIYTRYLEKFPDSYEKAISYSNVSLECYQQIGDYLGEATALHNIAHILQLQKKYENSLEYYNKSLLICKDILQSNYEVALAKYNIGVLYNKQNKLEEALINYNESITLLEKSKVFNACGAKCAELIRIYKQKNDKKMVLETYNQQLNYYKLANNKEMLADTFNNKAEFCKIIYNKDLALDSYEESSKLYKEIGNKNSEITILNGIGTLYDQYGEAYSAIDYYQRALSKAKDLKNSNLIVTLLNNIALAYSSVKDYERSVISLTEALDMPQPDNFKAVTLSNLGFVYSNLGDFSISLPYYKEALSMSMKIKDERNEAIITSNIAVDQLNNSNLKEAKENFLLALSKFKQTKNKKGQAGALTRLADIELKQGNKEGAKLLLEEALKIRIEIEDRAGEIHTRNLLGITQQLLNNYEDALVNFNKALVLSQELLNQNGELITLYNLSNFEREQKNFSKALSIIEGVVKRIENTRAKFTNRNFQSTYFATNQNYYELYIDILMSLHQLNPTENYDIKAFEVSEKMRARNLLELISEGTTTKKDNLELNYDDFKKRDELQNQLSYLATQVIKLKADSNKRDELTNIEQIFAKTKNKLELIETKISSKRQSDKLNVGILNIKEIQEKVLDIDTALIQYSLGKTNSYSWLITKTDVFVFVLPPRVEIENLAEKLYSSLIEKNKNKKWETEEDETYRIEKAEDEYVKLSLELSQTLLYPLEKYLQNKKRLLISPEGNLCFIPFSALPFTTQYSKSKFLIESYEIVNIPSSSTIALIRQKREKRIKPGRILVLADPVVDAKDERVSKIALSNNVVAITGDKINSNKKQTRGRRDLIFTRLLSTQKEATAIAKIFPTFVDELTGLKADKEAFMSLNLLPYSFIHFATHSLADTNQPELSTIVLSLVNKYGQEQNGFLTVSDIVSLKISPELITLSSCQTAIGKEKRGEGVIGLARAFFYSGAKRVISTLWSVNDESTSELMIKFYKNINKGLPPSLALRQAQLEMLKTSKYKSPYYWAPFQIQGEYK